MKRIALLTIVIAAVAVGAAHRTRPAEFQQYVDAVSGASLRAWENVEANPTPVFLAFGTFVLTVLYHKAKGKSLRESVEVAATRVTLVPVAAPGSGEPENPVVKRAKARATRTQLISDQIGLENRHRKLPDEVLKAEKEACYTEQAMLDTERSLAEKQKAHDEAVAKLEVLRKEKAAADAELAAIGAELRKLAEVI